MHGRKRAPPGTLPSADATAAIAKKVQTYRTLGGLAMQHRTSGSRTQESFDLNGQLLRVNPDVVTLWNYRRECLLERDTDATDSSLLAGELRVTADAIARNPKSYPAWHHRQWSVERWRGHCDLAAELALCHTLLLADERNFHCWNYRAWVARGVGATASAELLYARKRIDANFSNYSAWHYRTHLLPRAVEEASAAGEGRSAGAEEPERSPRDGGGEPSAVGPHPASLPSPGAPCALPLATLREELQLLWEAVFTEPDDQSPWFYRRWVLGCLEARMLADAAGAAAREAALALLREDIAQLRALAQAEPECRWPLLGMAQALDVLRRRSGGEEERQAAEEERRGVYARLVGMDGRHAEYYRHVARGV